jgi:hypothetical protein
MYTIRGNGKKRWLVCVGVVRLADAVLILNTLAPVFLLIAIGAGLQASKFWSAGFLKEANRVTYWRGRSTA